MVPSGGHSQGVVSVACYIALSNGAIADPLRPPILPNGVLYAPKILEWPYLRNGSFDPVI